MGNVDLRLESAKELSKAINKPLNQVIQMLKAMDSLTSEELSEVATDLERGDVKMIKTKRDELMETFKEAKKENATFVGVKIEMEGFPRPEVIINRTENFKKKLDYYLSAYNEDLEHNYSKGIKILDVQYADNMSMLAVKLGEEHIW